MWGEKDHAAAMRRNTGGKPAAEQTRDENLNRRDHEILRQPREEPSPHARFPIVIQSHRVFQPHVQENGDDQHG